jgi:hypothetical protein
MKRILLLGLCLLGIFAAKAQSEFAPIGATWYFDVEVLESTIPPWLRNPICFHEGGGGKRHDFCGSALQKGNTKTDAHGGRW